MRKRRCRLSDVRSSAPSASVRWASDDSSGRKTMKPSRSRSPRIADHSASASGSDGMTPRRSQMSAIQSIRKCPIWSSFPKGDASRAVVTRAKSAAVSRSSRSRTDPRNESCTQFLKLEDTLRELDHCLTAKGGGSFKHVFERLGRFLNLILNRKHLNDILAIYCRSARQIIDRHREIRHLERKPRCNTQEPATSIGNRRALVEHRVPELVFLDIIGLGFCKLCSDSERERDPAHETRLLVAS
uniref:Uncharacterized protein n=1 Tax=mine drainage metagenome TaxID=410659 RepID=E6QWQ1_9ZZZZ